MTAGEIQSGLGARRGAAGTSDAADPLRRLAEHLPRPVRFLAVGGCGLVTDLGVFSALVAHHDAPLLMRLVSLAAATLVTWRLNRALTFDRSGRLQRDEALRYALVTVLAQGISYTVFAALVLTALHWLPQVALICGAAAAAAFSYFGHGLFAFAPRRPGRTAPPSPIAVRNTPP